MRINSIGWIKMNQIAKKKNQGCIGIGHGQPNGKTLMHIPTTVCVHVSSFHCITRGKTAYVWLLLVNEDMNKLLSAHEWLHCANCFFV